MKGMQAMSPPKQNKLSLENEVNALCVNVLRSFIELYIFILYIHKFPARYTVIMHADVSVAAGFV
jgi:hypothetical protein